MVRYSGSFRVYPITHNIKMRITEHSNNRHILSSYIHMSLCKADSMRDLMGTSSFPLQ